MRIFKGTYLAAAAALAATLAFAAPAQAVTVTFGPGTDFDDGPGTVSFLLSGLDTNISSDLTIDFTVIGDLDSSIEYFDLRLDGTNYGRGCDNNTGNDSFGISSDSCSQSDNGFRDGSLTVSQSAAAALLSDGSLNISFRFSRSVDDFVDITAPQTRSGVLFGIASSFSFAAGGTVSYDTSPVPLPAGMPLMLAGLAAFGLARRARRRSE